MTTKIIDGNTIYADGVLVAIGLIALLVFTISYAWYLGRRLGK